VKVTKIVVAFLSIVIIILHFYSINAYANSNLNKMFTQQLTPNCGDVFNIKFTPMNYNSNMLFLSDDSFTVGDKLGAPEIYSDGISNGRYGIIAADMIETKQYFKSIIVKIDKIDSIYGNVMVEYRAKDLSKNYTEWLGADGHKGDKLTFHPFREYKYLQCRVRIITNDVKNAPIIKSISVKLCK